MTGVAWMVGLTIASTAMSTFGMYQQQQAAKRQANYQAQVARNNAVIAQQNADRIRMNKEMAEDEQRQRVEMTKGAARARLAANGLLVDDTEDATSQQLIQDIVEAGEYDVLKIRDNYEMEARRAELEGMNFLADASLMSMKASSINPGMAAFGTALEGAAKAAGTAYSGGMFKSTTAPTSAGSTTNGNVFTQSSINRSMWNR